MFSECIYDDVSLFFLNDLTILTQLYTIIIQRTIDNMKITLSLFDSTDVRESLIYYIIKN